MRCLTTRLRGAAILLALASFVSGSQAASQEQKAPASSPAVEKLYVNGVMNDAVCGIYGIGGVEDDFTKEPYVKGWHVALPWRKIEPAKDQFDWPFFDGELAKVAAAGKFISIQIQAGPNCPQWLFDAGVPVVEMNNVKSKHEKNTFPFYFNPLYKERYFNMIRKVGEHLRTEPPAVKERLIFWQSAEGSTGDIGPYKGDPKNKDYRISDEDWFEFKKAIWAELSSLCQSLQINVLINQGNGGQYFDYLLENIPSVFFKTGNVTHVYQFPGELEYFNRLAPIVNKPTASGNFHRIRGEMAAGGVISHGASWPNETSKWNVHSIASQCLYFGVDFFNGRGSDFKRGDPETYAFFDRHAGRKNPATAPGAFCVLRDGLDAFDTERFPESKYGALFKAGAEDMVAAASAEAGGGETATETGAASLDEDQKQFRRLFRRISPERVRAIAKDFEKYGARQPEPAVEDQRGAQALKDVGFGITRGNYFRYLKQIDPNETSRGWWRIGPTDQPYGRFARGFEHSSGRDAMYFDLDDRLFGGLPLAGKSKIELRIVYFDKGAGKWAYQYDSTKGPKTVTVDKTNTGRWIERIDTLEDANFGNGLDKKADLMLINADENDDLFSRIEVLKK